MEFYNELEYKLIEVIYNNKIDVDKEVVVTRRLTPKEGIGEPDRDDYPILEGKEALINSYYNEFVGQAYTDKKVDFKGSLKDVLNLELDKEENLPIFISTLNAVLRSLNLISNTIHCKDSEPKECAGKILEKMKELNPKNILLVGLQPGILNALSKDFNMRVLDLNPKNIGTEKCGVLIEDGNNELEEYIDFADVILVTGSTVCNGSIVNFLNLKKDVYFYGTSIAGTSYLMNLKRLCYCAK